LRAALVNCLSEALLRTGRPAPLGWASAGCAAGARNWAPAAAWAQSSAPAPQSFRNGWSYNDEPEPANEMSARKVYW